YPESLESWVLVNDLSETRRLGYIALMPQKKETIDDELGTALLRLFGTIPNVLERLKLTDLVTYAEARNALMGKPVREEAADLINDHARAWLRRWIKGVGDPKNARPPKLTFDLE